MLTQSVAMTAVAVCLAVSPAMSQPPGADVSVVRQLEPAANQRIVYYNDLNLSNEAGRDRLVRRVKGAVSDLCATRGNWTLEERGIERVCSKGAWASAQPQLDRAFANAASGLAVSALTISVQP
jgi:UrcA family protein